VPNYIRGLRWRAATTIVGALLVVAWIITTAGRGYIIRIDFTFVPEAVGADVVIDGETVDTLKMLRRQPINGIRVAKGEHVLVIQSDYCDGSPLTVVPIRREKTISIFVNVQERTVDKRFTCTFELRR
jgi:hypothetical protein